MNEPTPITDALVAEFSCPEDAIIHPDEMRAMEKRLRRCEAALRPFAAQTNCGIGFIVDPDDEHCERCAECQQILAARAALKKKGSGR